MKHGMSLIKAWPWNDERLAGKAEKNEAFFNAGGGMRAGTVGAGGNGVCGAASVA